MVGFGVSKYGQSELSSVCLHKMAAVLANLLNNGSQWEASLDFLLTLWALWSRYSSSKLGDATFSNFRNDRRCGSGYRRNRAEPELD